MPVAFYILLSLLPVAVFGAVSQYLARQAELAPFKEQIREARRTFQQVRGRPAFTSPRFLSLGIRPEWTREQTLAHLRGMGFRPTREDRPFLGHDELENYYRPVPPRDDGHDVAVGVMRDRDLMAPYERVVVYYNHELRPRVIGYTYRDVTAIIPDDTTRALNLVTGKVGRRFGDAWEFLGELGILRKGEDGAWQDAPPPPQ
ncbi:MAG: hypothetical protein HRU70_12445 [Phycisphaeraceae bacterium]|nr:MAG: hypothetical protein HRU70_12445 [Phycisphaeraceae bacterium]